MKKIVATSALLLLFVILPVMKRKGTQESGDTSTEALAQEQKQENQVFEIGVFEAKTLAPVLSVNSGVLSEILTEATRVAKGEVIARLDDEEIRNRLEAELESVEQERENLEAEIQELAVITNQYDAVFRLEKAELAHAELTLNKRKIPLSPEERRREEIGIELAELDVLDLEARLTRQLELVERNFAPKSSVESLKRDVLAAQSFLREKKTEYDLKTQPLTDEERLTLESEVRKARETVRRSEELHLQEVSIQELKLKGIHLKIDHAEEKIERLNQQLRDVNMTAPESGLFQPIQNYSWGSRRWETIAAGENIYGMDSIGSIVDPTQLVLHVLIHESDIIKVQPNMLASVTLTAFPGRTLKAKVTSVTAMGQDRDDLSPVHRQAPAVNQALFLAKLKVSLPEDLTVMPGMTANVRIQVETAP